MYAHFFPLNCVYVCMYVCPVLKSGFGDSWNLNRAAVLDWLFRCVQASKQASKQANTVGFRRWRGNLVPVDPAVAHHDCIICGKGACVNKCWRRSQNQLLVAMWRSPNLSACVCLYVCLYVCAFISRSGTPGRYKSVCVCVCEYCGESFCANRIRRSYDCAFDVSVFTWPHLWRTTRSRAAWGAWACPRLLFDTMLMLKRYCRYMHATSNEWHALSCQWRIVPKLSLALSSCGCRYICRFRHNIISSVNQRAVTGHLQDRFVADSEGNTIETSKSQQIKFKPSPMHTTDQWIVITVSCCERGRGGDKFRILRIQVIILSARVII